MFALGAGLEPLQAVPNTVVDARVIADFEVQAVIVFVAAPVPAVERAVPDEAYGACHDARAVPRKHGAQPVRHGLEELERQSRRARLAQESNAIEIIQRVPLGLAQLVAVDDFGCNAGIGDFSAFLANVLALFAGQPGQEMVEGFISLVRPVILEIAARQHAGLLQLLEIMVVAKQPVNGGQAIGRGCIHGGLDQLPPDRGAVAVRRGQQARAECRRERGRDHEFRVILEPVPVVGVGPGPVKYELAVGIVFYVGRAGTGQPAAVAGDHVVRLPAPGFQAVMSLQRQQEIMLNERVVGIDECIPCIRLDVSER